MVIKILARSFILYGLAFQLLGSCQNITDGDDISIEWEEGRAVSISVPFPDRQDLVVTLEGSDSEIFGNISTKGESTIFQPLIPFSAGLSYRVHFADGEMLGFTIPEKEHSSHNSLAIYPSQNTVPSNLLKVYLEFEKPMGEQHSSNYVFLLNEVGDTLPGTFLSLYPELWNKDRTRLTLWLDPGRIKRDLQPNLMYGAPLDSFQNYKMVVLSGWESRSGSILPGLIGKEFNTIGKDIVKPDWTSWEVITPVPGSEEPLVLEFPEPMDRSTVLSGIRVMRGNTVLEGSAELSQGEKGWLFQPDLNWEAGKYKLEIQSSIEDQAGNNLLRLFDQDIEIEVAEDKFYYIEFELH